jgi:hypothetical protein
MSMEKYLLRLYPRPWRERYEEELLALLEQRPVSLLDGLDLFFGALDAHLHPHLGNWLAAQRGAVLDGEASSLILRFFMRGGVAPT